MPKSSARTSSHRSRKGTKRGGSSTPRLRLRSALEALHLQNWHVLSVLGSTVNSVPSPVDLLSLQEIMLSGASVIARELRLFESQTFVQFRRNLQRGGQLEL